MEFVFGNQESRDSANASVRPMWVATKSKPVNVRVVKRDTELLLRLEFTGGIRLDSGLQTA